jgi:hypothetical protein
MIDAGFKVKTQTAWHAGVTGFIPHGGTTRSFVFKADTKKYRLSRRIYDARTDSIATDKSTYCIQEKIKMVGKIKKRRRKESRGERNKPHNLESSRILC